MVIVANGTYLAKITRKYGIGIVVTDRFQDLVTILGLGIKSCRD